MLQCIKLEIKKNKLYWDARWTKYQDSTCCLIVSWLLCVCVSMYLELWNKGNTHICCVNAQYRTCWWDAHILQECNFEVVHSSYHLWCQYVSCVWVPGQVALKYTGCPRRKGQNFGRVFLMLKYTDITQNTYIQSWTVTEIMAREKCGLLAGLRTVPCQLTAYRMSVLDCRVRLQKYRWRSYVSTPLWLTACHV